jgi:hypothetical protein
VCAPAADQRLFRPGGFPRSCARLVQVSPCRVRAGLSPRLAYRCARPGRSAHVSGAGGNGGLRAREAPEALQETASEHVRGLGTSLVFAPEGALRLRRTGAQDGRGCGHGRLGRDMRRDPRGTRAGPTEKTVGFVACVHPPLKQETEQRLAPKERTCGFIPAGPQHRHRGNGRVFPGVCTRERIRAPGSHAACSPGAPRSPIDETEV